VFGQGVVQRKQKSIVWHIFLGLWVKMGVFFIKKFSFVILWVKMGAKSGAMQ